MRLITSLILASCLLVGFVIARRGPAAARPRHRQHHRAALSRAEQQPLHGVPGDARGHHHERSDQPRLRTLAQRGIRDAIQGAGSLRALHASGLGSRLGRRRLCRHRGVRRAPEHVDGAGAAAGNPPLTPEAVKMDANRNGLVERSEATGAIGERFAQFDYNRDDVVSGAEIARGSVSDVYPPTTTYTDRHTVTLGGKRVTMTYLGIAHADDSSVLHFPDERAVFSADIMQVKRLPGGLAPHVGAWIDALTIINSLDFEHALTGHALAGTRRTPPSRCAIWRTSRRELRPASRRDAAWPRSRRRSRSTPTRASSAGIRSARRTSRRCTPRCAERGKTLSERSRRRQSDSHLRLQSGSVGSRPGCYLASAGAPPPSVNSRRVNRPSSSVS